MADDEDSYEIDAFGNRVLIGLSAEETKEFMLLDAAFKPAAGKWGLGGATTITLAMADARLVKNALATAWQNIAGK